MCVCVCVCVCLSACRYTLIRHVIRRFFYLDTFLHA